ncbi:hypothetical protein ACHAPT_003942 [Fusarium lateritium]
MTSEQLEAYVAIFRINEITEQLRTQKIIPTNRPRSPSPPPEYDSTGRRINTREQRYRRRLEEERHQLVETAMRTIPAYHPPYDYRRPTKISEKIYVPVTDFPTVNFIGQILGPRGSSLRSMSAKSGADIDIRGRGSIKEGRGRARRTAVGHEREPLHCLITAGSQSKIDKAKKLIQDVIETATSVPEHENERKVQQLRDLAIMNGTFRDEENQHQRHANRLIEGPQEGQRSTNTDIQQDDKSALDQEYQQFMMEIDTNQSLSLTNDVHPSPLQQAKPLPPWRADRMKGWNY